MKKLMFQGLALGVLLLFNCLVIPGALAQESESAQKPVIEIKKRNSTYSQGYVITLLQDRTVNFVSNFYGQVLRRSLVLSPDEFNEVLRLFDGDRFSNLTSRPVDYYLMFYGALAEITFFRDGPAKRLDVDDRSASHMELFRALEARLGVESLRCPFMIELQGKQQDLCVVEMEWRRKMQREK